MDHLGFILSGFAKDTEYMVCHARNGVGNDLIFKAQGTGTETVATIASELLKCGFLYKRTQKALVFEYLSLTDQEIPVLLCYPEGAEKCPIVFYNHGATGESVSNLFMGVPLAEAGFFTVLLDARMHGRRRDPDFDTKYSPKNYKNSFLKVILGTSEDISSLIDYFEDDKRTDTDRIGVTGISQGGYISFMAITKDKRIKAAAPIIGSPDLEAQFGNSLPFEDYDENVRAEIILHSPLRNLDKFKPTALLVQNGEQDLVVPTDGVRNMDKKLKVLYRDLPERYE